MLSKDDEDDLKEAF